MFHISKEQKWSKYGFLVTFFLLLVLNFALVAYVVGDLIYSAVLSVILSIVGALLIGRFEGVITGIFAGVIDSIILLVAVWFVDPSIFSVHSTLIFTGLILEFLFCIIGAIVGNITRASHLGFITTPH